MMGRSLSSWIRQRFFPINDMGLLSVKGENHDAINVSGIEDGLGAGKLSEGGGHSRAYPFGGEPCHLLPGGGVGIQRAEPQQGGSDPDQFR